ncbi:MarR family winged helix-turn-helix transcriptional regulator [Latilactobacillus sakei]
MNKTDLLNKLLNIAHQPVLIFANQIEETPDNTFATLKLLVTEKRVTAGRIAEYLDIKPSSVTQIIKKLEAAETVTKVKSETDARVTFVEITDKGRAAIAAQGNLAGGFNEALFKGFEETELEQFDDYLTRLEANLESAPFLDKVEAIFGDDRNWEHFGKMSARFGKAREKMMGQGGFGGFNHRAGFNGEYGGFEGWRKSRKQHK